MTTNNIVYAVEFAYSEYSDPLILHLFSSREKAEEWIKKDKKDAENYDEYSSMYAVYKIIQMKVL